MPVWAWYTAGAVLLLALLVGVFIWRRTWWHGPWLGPLFRYELVRLTRRGMQPRLRALYAVMLLVGLLITYLAAFADQDAIRLLFESNPRIPLARSSAFGSFFAAAYLYTQLLAVVLITPVYAGSAITEEKDRKSLDHLQGTLLSNREIILGKFFARMIFVAGVVLAGMPILALTSFYGGVDEYILFGGFAITLFTQLGLGSFSLYLGTKKDSLREVLYWSYGVILGLFCLSIFSVFPFLSAFSPFSAIGFLFTTSGPRGSPFGMSRESGLILTISVSAVLNLGLSVLFLYRAIRALRLEAQEEMTVRGRPIRKDKPKPAPKPVLAIAKPKATQVVAPSTLKYSVAAYKVLDAVPPMICDVADDRPAFTTKARRNFVVTPIQDSDPFEWKERYFTARLPVLERDLFRTGAYVVGVGFVLILLFSLFVGLVQREPYEAINKVARVYIAVAVIGMAIVMGIRTSGSLARERQRDTLLSLLTLPDARPLIIWAKWKSPFVWLRYIITSVFVVLLLSVVTGGIHPFGAIAGAIFGIGFVVLLNTLGLWLSVVCRTATRATAAYVVTLMALVLLPIFAAVVFESFSQRSSAGGSLKVLHFQAYAFCPPVGIWMPLLSWDEVQTGMTVDFRTKPEYMLIVTVIAGLFYTLLAFMLYALARKRFYSEGMN